MTSPDELDQMLQDCEVREEKLSEWERTFIDSLTHRRAKGNSLTEPQAEKLEQIWERVT
jgi:hypothetical protein